MLNNQISEKHLNRLSVVLNCIELTSDKKNSLSSKKIIKIFSSITVFFRRIYSFLIYREWFSHAKAEKIVKFYLFDVDADQKNRVRTEKIHQIYQKLIKLDCKEKPYLEGIESNWITDDTVDQLPKFRRVKGMSTPASKLLFQIHGNEFGANNRSYEGYDSKFTVEYLCHYLKGRQEQGLSIYGLSQAVLHELEDAVHLSQNNSEAITGRISKTFDEKKPLLMLGGWNHSSYGQTLCYEIIPVTQDVANMRIYHLGAGADSHCGSVVGNKVKLFPYIEFKGISKATFLDRNVLNAFIELKNHEFIPGMTISTEYNHKDVYKGLKELLKPKSIETYEIGEDSREILKSMQLCGVSDWRSLMAFMSTRMPKQEYKHMVCDIRLQSLVDTVSACQKKALSIDEWRLLKRSQQKLNRTITKAYQKGTIGKQYAFYACAELQKISRELDQRKSQALSRIIYDPKPNMRQWTSHGVSESFLNQNKGPPLHAQKSTASLSVQSCTFIFDKIQSINLDKTRDLKAVLKIANSAICSGEYHALHVSLIHWIQQLNADEFVQALTNQPGQLKEVMEDLGKLSKIFFATCFRVPEAALIHPDKCFTLTKLLYMQQKLAQVIEPIKFQKLSFNLKERDINEFIYKMAEVENFEEFNKYRNHNSGLSYSYMFRNGYFKHSSTMVFTRHITGHLANLDQLFPDIAKKIACEDSQFSKLPKTNQNANLYASNYLPEWFKALRDTHLYLMYLRYDFVANPPNSDFDCSLELQVEDIASNEVSYVHFLPKGASEDFINLYPEIQRKRRRPEDRYDSLFRPIRCPRLRQLMNAIVPEKKVTGYKTFKEKELAAADTSHLGLPEDLSKELWHILINEEALIAEALSFYMRNPNKLADPDYQVLFSIFMFHEGCLEREIKISGFAEKLAAFMQSQLMHYMGENQISTSVFLLRMCRMMQGYCQDRNEFTGTLPKLRLLLAKEALETEEKSLIYAEIIATLSKQKKLDEEDVHDLLIGSAYLQENPVPIKWACPQTSKEVRDAFHIHAKKIQNVLVDPLGKPNAILLNAVLTSLKGHESSWNVIEVEGEFPSFISTGEPKATYYPLNGRLVVENSKVILPLDIREHPYYQQLFKDVKEATAKEGNCYAFVSPAGHQTLLKKQRDALIIEQKRGNHWYRFVPREAFFKKDDLGNRINILSNEHLVRNHNHWQSIDNPSVIDIIEPQTEHSLYQIILRNQNIDKVKRLSDGSVLRKSCVFHIEHPLFVQEWVKDQKNHLLKQVELPRFGLSFTYDAKRKHLMCDQFKEQQFYVSKKQHIACLGSFSHYILLENSKGEKKVIIPKQWLQKPEILEYREALRPDILIDKNLSPEKSFKQDYEVFTVNKSGSLEAQSKNAHLFLSYILASVQEYDQATRLLRKFAPKLSAYTKEEEEALLNMTALGVMTGDDSGNGIAVRLYANYLLIKNGIDHHREIPKDLRQKLPDLFSDYLSHYHNITELKLTKQEEAYLLKFILNEKYDTKLFLRLNELDPDYARQYCKPVIEEHSLKKIEITSFQELKECPRNAVNGKPFEPSTMLLTRLGAYMQSHFFDFYQIALSGSEEQKKWLANGLIFLKHQQEAVWRALLECVLENPDKFPAMIQDHEMLWKQLLAVAHTMEKEKLEALFALEKAPQPMLNLTSSDFVLDAKTHAPASVEIDYQIPFLKTFRKHCEKSKCFTKKTITEKNGKTLEQWFSKEMQNPSSQEALYKKAIEGLANDLTEHNKNAITAKYYLNKEALEHIQKILNSGKKQAEKRLDALKFDMMEIANRLSLSASESVMTKLMRQSGAKKVITLDELFVYFAKKDTVTLLQRNPTLDKATLELLFSKIGEYLVVKTKEQQRDRAQVILHTLNQCTNVDEQHEHIQQLAASLLDTRSYDPKEHPAYLVFEYYGDLLLMKAQVEKLEILLKKGDINPVMAMIMGSGKSKVLLPLLGLLRADGKSISTLIVPQALFESVASDTQNILRDAFSQSLYALHFDRNAVFTPYSLRMILSELKVVQEQKECLIMTSKSVHCFILKFLEKCKEHLPKGEFPEELQLMQQILSLIEHAAYPLIDEIDTVLNVLHEVCFSIGKKVQVQPSEINVIAEIYDLLYSDMDVKTLARLDCDPQSNPDAPVLTEAVYHDKVKDTLADKLLERLKNISFESSSFTKAIQTYFGSLDVIQKELIKRYLCRDTKWIKDAQKFYDAQPDEIKNILALAAEEISNFLPHTLTRNCNEKYGLDEKNHGIIAIPFAAANTPNSGSQFANAYITINYTFQQYMKQGVTRELLLSQIERLQSDAMKELKENKGMTVTGTHAWQTFLKLRGESDIPLFNIKDMHLDQLADSINRNKVQKRQFVSEIVLPQLDLFSHKIGCNALNLVSSFAKAAGFTGTLWNSQSMHSKLQAMPEAGTDMKTIKVLWENSRYQVHTIKEGSPEAMFQQLSEQGVSYDLISDAGGYFKEGGNLEIARQLAKYSKRPVVFYNKQNEQSETNGTTETLLSDSKTPIEGRVTFLDQSRTTGADVKQKLNAVGVVTIGRNMLLRDLLQAVWRLRGLEKGQKVKFVLNDEVDSIILQTLKKPLEERIRFDDILRFVIINQITQQGKDNFKGLRQELGNVMQALLLEVLLKEGLSNQERTEAFQLLENKWIKESCLPPKDLYGVIGIEEESQLIIEQEEKNCLDQLDVIFKELSFLEPKGIEREAVKVQVTKICKEKAGILSKKIVVPLRAMDSDQTMEMEQQTQQETQTQIEVQH